MKKAGKILFSSGLTTLVLVIILSIAGVLDAFPFYMLLMVVFTITPIGLSFLAFDLPLQRRKKIATIALFIGIFLTAWGYFSKRQHWPGAGIAAIIGVVILCLYYGPLVFKNKFDKWKIYARSKRDAFLLSLFDFLGVGTLLLGLLFKFMHWPGANIMSTIGLVTLAIGLIAWNQKFKGEVVFRKETEDKLKISLEQIEESHKEISDSINYAKRLQDAILPPLKQFQGAFKDSFVLYKPKAIVAGDFYWLEKKDNLVFVAAADCTGHGVPGAIVSVVCSNALNRAVLEMNLKKPGEILDKVTELVMETFQKSGDEVKDGMDISMICFDLNETNSEQRSVTFSGANNPLWLVRGNELIEIKGDKQPIGFHENRKPFKTHEVELKQGDSIYLFTDGYADQFGGPKGKKFKYKQLSEKLISIGQLSMEKQKNEIETIFQVWKADLEQVDDVCVIGIRF